MRYAVWIMMLLGVCASACTRGRPAGNPADFVKPSIAVMKFENRAAFPMRWDLGSGTRDILVDRLMRTNRYHVIERPELSQVVSELNFQNSGMTRAEDKAARGRIKNIQYLIKGVITDFSQVGGAKAHAEGSKLGVAGGSSSALVSIIIYVVDVESGEIITSEAIEESVHSSSVGVEAMYKDVSFGGSAFYRTPLGKAMNRVVERAVAKVTDSIANRRWSPRVAEVHADGTVLVTGGADRGMSRDQMFEVVEEGPPVLDPETGDVLGNRPARVVANIRITEVSDRYSEGAAQGDHAGLKVGQLCRPMANSK